MRKDTRKANVLASATQLSACLLEDPMNIGRKRGWSPVLGQLAQVGKRGCPSHGRDVGAGGMEIFARQISSNGFGAEWTIGDGTHISDCGSVADGSTVYQDLEHRLGRSSG